MEATYLLEKEIELKEEEEKRQKLLRGNNESDRGESEVKPREYPTHTPHKVYRNRTECLIERLEEGVEGGILTEDNILQLSWQPETLPTSDELKKRQEMRKEQGKKLKELMAKKRAEKKKNLENEYADLQSLQSLKVPGQTAQFNEELTSRGLQNEDGYVKRLKFLSVKLGLEPEETKED